MVEDPIPHQTWPPSYYKLKISEKIHKKIILIFCKESNAIKPYGRNAYVIFFQNLD
jgi:hypothetical protein